MGMDKTGSLASGKVSCTGGTQHTCSGCGAMKGTDHSCNCK